VAVTDFAADMTTVHVLVPLHPAPVQPENRYPAPGVAVSVTVVPDAYVCDPLAQSAAQLSGPESAATVLVEPPTFETVSSYAGTKVAVIVRSELIVTAHVSDESSHASEPVPDHPVKVDPLVALAASVTTRLFSKVLLQLLGDEQAIPSGVDATEPLPAPAKLVVRVRELNVAAT